MVSYLDGPSGLVLRDFWRASPRRCPRHHNSLRRATTGVVAGSATAVTRPLLTCPELQYLQLTRRRGGSGGCVLTLILILLLLLLLPILLCLWLLLLLLPIQLRLRLRLWLQLHLRLRLRFRLRLRRRLAAAGRLPWPVYISISRHQYFDLMTHAGVIWSYAGVTGKYAANTPQAYLP